MILSCINELRKKKIRKQIEQDLSCFDIKTILDNGCGDYGSFRYTPNFHIISSDLKKGQDATNLPYKSKSFDCVVFTGVIQYISEPHKAIKECKRVLKKDGILIISTMNLKCSLKRLTKWKEECNVWQKDSFIEFVESFGFELIDWRMIDFDFIKDKNKMVIYCNFKVKK